MGVIAGWSHDKPDTIWFAFGLTIAISILGFFFCRWWREQLIWYKDLNTAKFDVLNEMAPYVVFPGYANSTVKSAEPFDREWKRLEERKQLQPRGNKGVFALKASLSELMVPISFQLFFVMTAVMSLAVVWAHYGDHIRQMLHLG